MEIRSLASLDKPGDTTDPRVTQLRSTLGLDHIIGESPGDVRARQRAAPHALERVPHCFVRAAQRPDLTIAVSEKRRQEGGGIKTPSKKTRRSP